MERDCQGTHVHHAHAKTNSNESGNSFYEPIPIDSKCEFINLGHYLCIDIFYHLIDVIVQCAQIAKSISRSEHFIASRDNAVAMG